ncbi:MAG: isoamylase early set domain-containing protein [Marinilabiliaceae bacterium]|nr:isoamylase early set domain-containing protein [Marinilabiliaceae bacterium]
MIKKQFLKSRPECKVTFKVKEIPGIESVETVKVVGDFNKWNIECEPMDQLKNGSYTQVLKLETGRRVQFRYLVNNDIWLTDEEADEFADTGIGNNELNSVLVL